MQNIKKYIKNNLDNESLKNDFYSALKNKSFKELRNLINLEDKYLYKYTSLIEDSALEFSNCKECKGLSECKNELQGYLYFPNVLEETLSFAYLPCKYKKKEIEDTSYYKKIDLYDVPKSLKNAKIKEFYTDDKSRNEIIRYIINYEKKYFTDTPEKGLYLSGNFGSGKTYMIAALFNELAKKNIYSAIIYFPEFLRTLKASFKESSEDGSFSNKFDYIKRVSLLLIDDIGAENVTSWGRDEILGTLLQYRMERNLPTFFTSNLSMNELEIHLASSKDNIDKVKARRIIERIKYLTNEMKLVGENRR